MFTQTFSQPFVEDKQNLVHTVMQVIGGSLFIALCSQIKINLFFTPVPLTLQTLAVLLLGGLFGSKKGFWMVIAYLTEITAGMPFLAGGISDPFALIGPKAGYLMGFACQAYVMGLWIEKMANFNLKKTVLLGFTTCVLNLILGASWLAHFVGWSNAWVMGVYPFLIGELLKALVVANLLKQWRFN